MAGTGSIAPTGVFRSFCFAPFSQQPPTGSGLKLEGEQRAHFDIGVEAVFRGWTSLQLCLENVQNRAKAGKAVDDMVEDIKDWFVQEGEIFPDEIEAYLNNEISETMDAGIEDGSVEQVSEFIADMFRECVVNNFTKCEQAKSMAQNVQEFTSQAVQSADVESCDGDSEDGGFGAPALCPAGAGGMEVDEEGPSPLEAALAEISTTLPKDAPLADRVTALQAINQHTASLLEAAGASVPSAKPKNKKKKVGKNNVEVDNDGWTTVK